jgi:hypothetical protein
MTSVQQGAFTDARLHTNKDLFVLVSGNSVLSINRKTNAVSTVSSEAEQSCIRGDGGVLVHGILGTIKFPSGNYLVVIKERLEVAEIFGNKIYRIVTPLFIPFAIDVERVLSAELLQDERQYLDLLKSTFYNQAFYLSYTYDMTTHLQNWFKSDKKSLWREADDHFMWNKYLARDLITAEADGWIVPMIRGCMFTCFY